MASIDAERSHTLSLDEARKTVEAIVEDVRASNPALVDTIQWNADRTAATLKGKMFKGEFEVDEDRVSVHIELGLMARPFKGKVEERINKKLDQYFGPASA